MFPKKVSNRKSFFQAIFRLCELIQLYDEDFVQSKNAVVVCIFLASACLMINVHALPRPELNSCAFYQEIDSIKQCSAHGFNYFTAYAKPYCEDFLRKNEHWHEPLKTWIPNVAFCLQEALVDYSDKSCLQLEKMAF